MGWYWESEKLPHPRAKNRIILTVLDGQNDINNKRETRPEVCYFGRSALYAGLARTEHRQLGVHC